jgi:hypothetical protein
MLGNSGGFSRRAQLHGVSLCLHWKVRGTAARNDSPLITSSIEKIENIRFTKIFIE